MAGRRCGVAFRWPEQHRFRRLQFRGHLTAGHAGWRASRHPERTAELFPDVELGIESIHADINDDRSVAASVVAVEGVVNAVSFYVESGQETFQSVHVTGAARVAWLAREAGVRHLIHVSGIGSDAGSASPYIRSRGPCVSATNIFCRYPTAVSGEELPRTDIGATSRASDDAFQTAECTILKSVRRHLAADR
jgi:nucleoside-diphosphate-sugar epimerase